jgi:predicted DsbA family dithiol-disulfide isomerase
MTAPSTEKLTIDVISDVVCPWCYIGKRRLEAALAELVAREPAVRPFVSWHPFQLNPDLPREGIPRRAYLEAKFGGASGVTKFTLVYPPRVRRSAYRLRSSASSVNPIRAMHTG